MTAPVRLPLWTCLIQKQAYDDPLYALHAALESSDLRMAHLAGSLVVNVDEVNDALYRVTIWRAG